MSLIIWPTVLQHIKSVSLGGFGVDLKEIQERQDQFDKFEQLVVDGILPFLIPGPLLKPLKALEGSEQGTKDPADKYTGNDHLRSQLRTLRDLGLIEPAPGHHSIGEVKDGRFNLADYVRLTPRGREWTRRARRASEQTASALED